VPQLRVMTYNIWRGGRGGRLLDRAVRAADPDVILVNESPKTPCLWRHRVRHLAGRWNMTYVAGGRDAGANMIAVKPHIGVTSSYTTVLRQPLLQPRRGIAAAQLRVPGHLFGVVSCHLSLHAGGRAGEVEQVLAVADRLRGPVVVGGDLNESPAGPSWRRLRSAGYADHGTEQWPTFPAGEPVKRIDALLVRGAAQVRRHGDPGVEEALQRTASDHRAVLAVIDLDVPPAVTTRAVLAHPTGARGTG
jgi:endonuclease/exonuclease/phosphatase family metal-dependent hydrolase